MFKKQKIIILLSFFICTMMMSVAALLPGFTTARYITNVDFTMGFPRETHKLSYEIWFMSSPDENDNQYVLEGFLDENGDILRDEEGSIVTELGGQKAKELKVGIGDDFFDFIEGYTLDNVFTASRAETYLNNTFAFYVNINAAYTAKIFWNSNDADPDELVRIKNINDRDKDLGAEPIYEVVDVDEEKLLVPSDKGPNELKLSYAGYNNGARRDFRLVVQLTKKENIPTFSASYFISTKYASGRGAFGVDKGYGGSTDGGGNLEPLDKNWQWNQQQFGNNPQDLIKADDGTYGISFAFQTNNTSGGYTLDSLAINGYDIDIPFQPHYSYTSNGDLKTFDDNEYFKTTVLPDGTIINLTLERIFNTNTIPQRVYLVDISNTYTNITITNGNLMQGNGAHEMVVYSLTAVENNAIELDGKAYNRASLFVYEKLDNTGTMRVQLKEFYDNITARIENIDGDQIELFVTKEKPDDPNDRWYLVEGVGRNDKFYNEATINGKPIEGIERKEISGKIALLYITATPKKYAIRYVSGSVKDATMSTGTSSEEVLIPSVDINDASGNKIMTQWMDDNNGLYYTIESSPLIFINDRRPKTDETSNGLSLYFTYWTMGENNTTVSNDVIFNFDEISQLADEEVVINGETIYVITLTANWAERTWDNVLDTFVDDWVQMEWEDWYEDCWQQWSPIFYDEWTNNSGGAKNGK